jgi:hypothetical protein
MDNPQAMDSFQQKPKLFRTQKLPLKLRRLLVILPVLVLGLICCFLFLAKKHNGKHLNGSQACISYVKQFEGKDFEKIYSLSCHLEPRTIANSNLQAYYLEYDGTPKNAGDCLDPGIDPSAHYYCPGWWGIVLSNGKKYPELGNKMSILPLEYDYCYGNRIPGLPRPVPSLHDLYFYKGDLYDRDVYKDVQVKTPFGTCALNGTSLANQSADGDLNQFIVTNVIVSYESFPNDCIAATIGKSTDDEQMCIDLVTAAHANLNACYSNQSPIVVDNKITGYKTENQLYIGQHINGDCQTAFTQHMAALNQCQSVADNLKDACTKEIDRPFNNITRTHAAL